VSVVVSIAVAGTGVHYLLDFDWRTSLTWGAVLSSTDVAAVFSVLRRVGIRPLLGSALELESGLNDAPVVIAVLLFGGTGAITWTAPALVIYELVVGAAIGLGLGFAGAWWLRRGQLPANGLYPLATLAITAGAYASARFAHSSGFLATYLAALVLGNSTLPQRASTLAFADGFGWLAQIGLFVLLGLYVDPGQLPAALLPGVLIGLMVLIVARPLSVIAAATPFRLPWRDQAFLSYAGLRGAVPIVLALIPLTLGREHSEELVAVLVVAVVIYTLVQGTTLPMVARLLRSWRPAPPTRYTSTSPRSRRSARTCCRCGCRRSPGCAGSTSASFACRPGPRWRCSCATANRSRSTAAPASRSVTGCSSSPRRGSGRPPNGASGRSPASAPSPTGCAAPGARPTRPHVCDTGGVSVPETHDEPAGEAAPARWRRLILVIAIAACVLAIDIVTKALIVASIAPGQNVRILGGLVYLTQIRNAGAAFNMGTSMTWVLAVIAVAVVVFIVRIASRLRSTPWAVCLGLILGGALGNLTDRIFRAPGVMRGHVVDFISVFGPDAEHFPAFNAADSAITIGGVMLVIIALAGYDFDGRRHRHRDQHRDRPPDRHAGRHRDQHRGRLRDQHRDRLRDRHG
jgi:lipoprotein signal peptidase